MKKYAYFPLLLAASTMMFSCGGGDAPSSSKTDGGSSATSAVPENQATVTIDAQGGVFSDGTSTKQMTVTKGVEFTIEETPTKEGYVFSGWADGVNAISKWSYDGRWTTNRDVTIYAHYKGAPHTVTLSSSNEDFGTVSATGLESDGTARNGAKITFQATPKTGYALEGWYIDEELVSTKDEYEFTMPNKDINVVGKFWTEGENGLRLLGASPAYWPETQTYTYGMYPQTWAGAEITAEIRKDGHPLGGGYYTYGEKLYLEAKSSDGAADYKFDDGTKMESSTDYFFLCEAISWIALTSGDGSHYACSEKSARFNEIFRVLPRGRRSNKNRLQRR